MNRKPDGLRPDVDRWMEAVLGARLRFHARDIERTEYWGSVYKRWAQLYHRTYDPSRWTETELRMAHGDR
jgi:hypothetical protein